MIGDLLAPGRDKSKIISAVGWGGDVPESTAQSPSTDSYDRLLTVPNLLSVLRLLGVPLFLWLLLGPHADVAALVVLALSGISDWADGVLARGCTRPADWVSCWTRWPIGSTSSRH